MKKKKIYPRYFIALFDGGDIKYRIVESPNSFASMILNDGRIVGSNFDESLLDSSTSFKEVLKPELALLI